MYSLYGFFSKIVRIVRIFSTKNVRIVRIFSPKMYGLYGFFQKSFGHPVNIIFESKKIFFKYTFSGRVMMKVLELIMMKADMIKIMLTVFKHNEVNRMFQLDNNFWKNVHCSENLETFYFCQHFIKTIQLSLNVL